MRGIFTSRTKKNASYEIEHRQFIHFLVDESGLSSTEVYFKFALDMLLSYVSRHGQLVEISALSICNLKKGNLIVSNSGNGIWKYQGNHWIEENNGLSEGLFLTEIDADLWHPDFRGQGERINLVS